MKRKQARILAFSHALKYTEAMIVLRDLLDDSYTYAEKEYVLCHSFWGDKSKFIITDEYIPQIDGENLREILVIVHDTFLH